MPLTKWLPPTKTPNNVANACDPTSLVSGAACLDCGIPPGMQKAVIIYLLCQIAGMTCSPTSLAAGAACLECGIPPGMENAVIIYLLCQIANSGGAGGGLTCGNYAGNQPTFTPASGCALALDTSNGRPWWYYNGQWN